MAARGSIGVNDNPNSSKVGAKTRISGEVIALAFKNRSNRRV
jgi:hypothetical protein